MLKIISVLIFIVSFSFHLTAEVLSGLEVLVQSDFKILEGKRVGLLTNPTGVDRNLKPTVDILFEAKNVNLVALFAPEHGVRGDEYAGVEFNNTKDERTGLPVYSLHGKERKPTPEMLKHVDVIVYDVQDIGCRSYTFISSLGLLMEAAAENGKEVVVLDRPNPLGGLKVEGPLVEQKYISFVSQYPIPYIYGLTCGELAQLINKEGMNKKSCQLTVVKMKGWCRSMRYSDTGLPWILTSPHIPQISSALAYPMSGIVGELNALSIGVGYTLPFEVFGAEWIASAELLADKLNSLHLDGIRFRPITYQPFYSFGKGKLMKGVQVFITDYDKAKLTEVQFYVLQELHKLYPNKNPFTLGLLKNYSMFDNVCGSNNIRIIFGKRFLFSDIMDYWRKDADVFSKHSRKYWMYDK